MKTIQIKEAKLIDIIEELSNKEIERKKQVWLAEEKAKWITETKIKVDKKLVERINELEKKLLLTNK